MDSDVNPDYYRDASPKSAISDTKATIEYIRRIDPSFELISPIITPRFAPSCSSALLASLGALADESNLPIQTHIAENPAELALVAERFPSYDSYAAVYDAYGLLTPRSVLAHAIHLSPSERKLIGQRRSSVSHCPVSNSSISSGICPVRELLDEGIEVGLGTDVSGGWSPSVLVAAREAAMVSRILAAFGRDFGIRGQECQNNNDEITRDDVSTGKDLRPERNTNSTRGRSHEDDDFDRLCEAKKLSIEECLYLATAGGAKCLGLGEKVGRFDIGMEWDAQMIQLEELSTDASDTESDDDVPNDEQETDGSSTVHKNPNPCTGHEQHRHHRRDRARNERAQRKNGDEDDNKGPIELWGMEKWAEKVAKWAFCGDDRNTKTVWVKGRLVHGVVK